jgi:ABC-type Fe3+ transport system substrate-binding protein
MRTLIAAAMLAAAAGPAAAQQVSPALAEVAAAAKKEGSLDLLWGEGTLGGSSGVKLFERGINAMFGTNLKLTFTPGQSMPAVGNDIAMKQAANQPSSTDVYIASADALSRLYARKIFVAAEWKAMLPGRITDAMVEADGMSVKLTTAMPGIAYNTRLSPSKPASLADLLKPEFKGKIASTPYAAFFDVMASNGVWGAERALDYARKLSAQISGLIRCNEGDRLASGEFVAFAITCSGTDFAETIKKGAPIAQVQARDFPMLGYFYLSVPKNAKHPNAAKLFVAYAMTAEGQKLVRETWNTDLHLFAGSATGAQVAEFRKTAQVEPKNVDIAWYLAHPEGFEAWKEIGKILQKK